MALCPAAQRPWSAESTLESPPTNRPGGITLHLIFTGQESQGPIAGTPAKRSLELSRTSTHLVGVLKTTRPPSPLSLKCSLSPGHSLTKAVTTTSSAGHRSGHKPPPIFPRAHLGCLFPDSFYLHVNAYAHMRPLPSPPAPQFPEHPHWPVPIISG